MLRIFVIINAIVSLICFNLVIAELRVTQVQVLFRHGERTPIEHETCPTDIHGPEAYQPWGYMQLTNAGKLREFQLGELLKNRYEGLLSEGFNASEIWALSTDTERTKMSLQLVLAGLFPPLEEFIWNPELPWLPIAFSYVPQPIDNLFKTQHCPEYANARAEAEQLPEVKEKTAVYEDLFRFLTTNCGRRINSTSKAYEIYNLLVSQKALNLSMPEWYTDELFDQMAEMTKLEYEIASYTTDQKRILGGPMVKKFTENMWLDKNRENPRKMYLYSAHETTITAFLYAQGISGLKLPHYGTAVMFEKLEDDNGKVFVKVSAWTGVTEQMKTLRLTGCEDICPIETYLRLTREVIPSDEELNCHWRRLSALEVRNLFENENVFD